MRNRHRIAVTVGVCIAIATVTFVLQSELAVLVPQNSFGPCILAPENACVPEWAINLVLWACAALGIGAAAYAGLR